MKKSPGNTKLTVASAKAETTPKIRVKSLIAHANKHCVMKRPTATG